MGADVASNRYVGGKEELASWGSERRRRVIVCALVGNAIEFYDFVVFAFFATYIGRAFFPTSAGTTGVLLTLAVFGAGFVARPIGAIALGLYADRRGRRPAMLLTIWLITGATCVMALLPTYRDIGVLAPVLLTICRVVQGFCFGGEVGPSIAYLAEVAPSTRRGLYCAAVFAGQGAAVCVAGIIGTATTWYLTAEQMQDWGWRLPFLAAAAATPFALVLRRQMPESLNAAQGTRPHQKDRGAVVALSFAILGGTVANYVCSYLPTYASLTLGMKAVASMSVAIMVGLATLVFGLLGGWLADVHGRRVVLLASRLACALFAVPLFAWLAVDRSTVALWVTAAVLAGLNAINAGALFVSMAESFVSTCRATSISIIYAVGVAIFGGSTQFVVAWLGQASRSPMAPGWYLLATSLVAFVALWPLAYEPASRAHLQAA